METTLISIHFEMPIVAKPDVFQIGNWIGASLLHKLVSLALYRDGLMEENAAGSIGELNDFIFMAPVKDAERAVETIKNIIGKTMLFQVAIFDNGVHRCIYPSTNIRTDWLFDTERHEFAQTKMFKEMIQLQALLKES